MIKVEERAIIRRAYHIEGKSIRAIARELGYARQSIRKIIASDGATPPQSTRDRISPILGPYQARIEELYAESEALPRKQRYTAKTIFKILQSEDYQGSQSTVGHYLAHVRKQKRLPKVYLPLAFEPGEDAQVDWGEAIVIMRGEQIKVQLFVMRLSYSRRVFMMAFPNQKQEAFFEGHIEAFKHFGGIPHRISYDNLKTAVQKVLRGKKRQEQTRFTAFRSHYLFDSHFCTPRAGHEKGGVEHSVGYLRRNYLTPLLQVNNYQDLNEQLKQSCFIDDERQVTGQTESIKSAWIKEKPLLCPIPNDTFDYSRTLTVTLNPYSQVVIDTNRYSVPVDKRAKRLIAKIYPFRIDIHHPEEKEAVATHPRSYGRQEDIFNPMHYLPLMEKRPGALKYAKPMRQWRETWPKVYETLLARLEQQFPDGKGIREFIRILQLHREHPTELVEKAITQSLEFNCAHTDGVMLCLHELKNPTPMPEPLDLSKHPKLANIGSQAVELANYDRLLVGEACQ